MPQDPRNSSFSPDPKAHGNSQGQASGPNFTMTGGVSLLGNGLGVAAPGVPGGNLQVIPLPYYAASPSDVGQEDEFNLQQFSNTIRRRIAIVSRVAAVVTLVSWVSALNQRPVYQGNFRILIEDIWSNSTADAVLSPTPSNLSNLDASGKLGTQIEVLTSPGVLDPIYQQIAADYPDLTYAEFSSNLQVQPVDGTKVLGITYQDTDPVRVQAVLEAVSQAYLSYSSQQQQHALSQGISFVENQLPSLQGRVDQKQKELEAFRQRYSLIDPESEGTELSGLLNAVRSQQQSTRADLAEAEALYVLLQRQVGSSPDVAVASAALSESGHYQALLNQVQEVESTIAVESARFTDNSPAIQTLMDKRSNLLQLLEIEAQRVLGGSNGVGLNDRMTSIPLDLTKQLISATNKIQVLRVRANALQAAERQFKEEFSLIPQLSRQYTDLQRELSVATESLNRFLSTRENLQIEASQQTKTWQLIAKPTVAGEPVSPGLSRNLGMGLLAGLVLGVGAGLLRDRFDNVFHSIEELKETIKLPILGLIPYAKDLENIGADPLSQTPALQEKFGLRSATPTSVLSQGGYASSPFQEAFRVLYSNIRFLASDSPIRSITLSSSLPGDGKSTISLYLAQAAAAMGMRVLVVDADMRRPQIHKRLNIDNMRGLSNILASNLTPDDVIQVVDADLSVLTAGQIPPDPTKLLSSQRMAHLIEQFEACFDLVIYDTPPLLGLADANLLATHTDGLILVLGLGKTERSPFKTVLDHLKLSSVPLLGLVANGITEASNYSNGYHYYQSYYNRPTPTVTTQASNN